MLSSTERKERVKNLSDKYRQFLAEVEPIMQPEELETFLLLESDAQRDLYIEDFWHRRDLAREGPRAGQTIAQRPPGPLVDGSDGGRLHDPLERSDHQARVLPEQVEDPRALRKPAAARAA